MFGLEYRYRVKEDVHFDLTQINENVKIDNSAD